METLVSPQPTYTESDSSADSLFLDRDNSWGRGTGSTQRGRERGKGFGGQETLTDESTGPGAQREDHHKPQQQTHFTNM